MKVIAYARVSTDEQATAGKSLESQREKLIAYAALYDLELIEVIEDPGESAKSLKRPGLEQALAVLRDGEAEGLVVTKLDRLTRSVSDWQKLIEGYFGEHSGKQLFSIGDSIDTRTAAGRLVLNMLLSVAQWEREVISERTREALQYKIANGERCGKLRYGFDLDADGKTLIPNPEEQDAIAVMQEMRDTGHSFREIADELEHREICTKSGDSSWQHTSVMRILERDEEHPVVAAV